MQGEMQAAALSLHPPLNVTSHQAFICACSITWPLGGEEAVGEWIEGAAERFYGCHNVEHFFCSMAIVAEIPAYPDRPSLGPLTWAGTPGAAQAAAVQGTGGGATLEKGGSPEPKRTKHATEGN